MLVVRTFIYSFRISEWTTNVRGPWGRIEQFSGSNQPCDILTQMHKLPPGEEQREESLSFKKTTSLKWEMFCVRELAEENSQGGRSG